MHERIRIVVHTCIMVIACACAIILHACTVTQMRVYHSFFTVHFRTYGVAYSRCAERIENIL